MNEPLPIPVTEIVNALERESANTDTDPRWLAAQQMRQMAGWESRTLMCRAHAGSVQVVASIGKAMKDAAPACPTCKGTTKIGYLHDIDIGESPCPACNPYYEPSQVATTKEANNSAKHGRMYTADELQKIGACEYCEKPIPHDKRFCSLECAEADQSYEAADD